MLENKIAIIGYGGHAYVVAESLLSKGKSLSYYTSLKQATKNPYNLEYLGIESEPNFIGWQMELSFILGIGDNNLRYNVAKLILSKSQIIENVIDSNSVISKTAEIGDGVFVSKGVLINALSKIGDFTILNTGCIIEHECEIGKAVHISPGAVLAGNVKIGNRSFVGANSVIKEGVEIGDDVIIGAGSVILKNIKGNSKVVGNPARFIY